jgi:hypothetical protein
MNRNRLIVLQVVGGLSILVYPAVLIANIMAMAAPGHKVITSLPWVLLSFYPIVWGLLFWLSWRAMARGAVRLAFAMSSIPAFACLLPLGVIILSWIAFFIGLGGGGSS